MLKSPADGAPFVRCVVVQPPKTETRKGYKNGYYSRPLGAFCVLLCKAGVQVANMLTYRMVAQCSSWCEPWLGALSRAPRPEAACYRPRRVPGGDGHTEPLPTARLLFGSGHYPLCRGWNRPPETSAPFGGPGCAGCCGTRLGVLRGWMDYTVGGAFRPRPPDSQTRPAG